MRVLRLEAMFLPMPLVNTSSTNLFVISSWSASANRCSCTTELWLVIFLLLRCMSPASFGDSKGLHPPEIFMRRCDKYLDFPVFFFIIPRILLRPINFIFASFKHAFNWGMSPSVLYNKFLSSGYWLGSASAACTRVNIH